MRNDTTPVDRHGAFSTTPTASTAAPIYGVTAYGGPLPKAGTFYCTTCNQRSPGDHCLQCEPVGLCHSCGLIDELCCCNPELDVQEGVSSEPTSEAEFDELIEQASVPSLDALFQRAIKKGVISGSSPVYSWMK